MKKHLKGGVLKGAFTEEQAEEKFTAWLSEKEGTISGKASGLQADADAMAAKALEAEKAVNEARIAANTPEVVEEPAAVGDDATEEEE